MKLWSLLFFPCITLMAAGPTFEASDYNSQASQDQFVYTLLYRCLDKQDPGFYLEIGAGEPISINNSYFFEKNLSWQGVSIDISEDLDERWYAARSNRLLTQDATTVDYRVLLSSFPKVIDYLSLDVDGFYDAVLLRIPFAEYQFKIITIEHDAYRFGDEFRLKERAILTGLGYQLLCSNVCNQRHAFEDWWVHPSAFPSSFLTECSGVDLNEKEHTTLIETLQNLISENASH